MKNIPRLILCLLLPLAVGALAGFIISDSIQEWYPTLAKPAFNPPNSIFGPVWTFLYILMGISLYFILQKEPSPERTTALYTFGIQLFLNFWWSIFFFAFKRPEIAMVEILCLWFSILWMIGAFRLVDPKAAWLQIPYLLWVTFATLLNISIWMLN